MLVDAGLFAARWLVGGVLLIAGLAKIRSGAGPFLKAILGYDLLPRPVAVVMANVLPWLEALAGGLLLAGLWTHLAALLGVGLLLLFSGAVAVSLLRGKRQECGCFSSLTPVQWRLVYRNLGLMALLLPVHAWGGGAWSVDEWLSIRHADSHPLFTISVLLSAAWLMALIAALLLQRLTHQKPIEVAEQHSQ